jgi:hypothetical protein
VIDSREALSIHSEAVTTEMIVFHCYPPRQAPV